MRKILIFCIVTLLLNASPALGAGLLNITGTSPAYDNAGTCFVPLLLPRAATPMWIHFIYTGPESGRDSLQVATNAPFTYSKQLLSGTYTIRAYPQDEGGAGCDTTITKTIVESPPWKIRPTLPIPVLPVNTKTVIERKTW
jgi:hypothetical protein